VLYDEAALRYLMDELHVGRALPLLAAYPQEILGRIVDFAGFNGMPPRLTVEALDQAWTSMFASDEPGLACLAGDDPMAQLVDQLAQRSAHPGV